MKSWSCLNKITWRNLRFITKINWTVSRNATRITWNFWQNPSKRKNSFWKRILRTFRQRPMQWQWERRGESRMNAIVKLYSCKWGTRQSWLSRSSSCKARIRLWSSSFSSRFRWLLYVKTWRWIAISFQIFLIDFRLAQENTEWRTAKEMKANLPNLQKRKSNLRRKKQELMSRKKGWRMRGKGYIGLI